MHVYIYVCGPECGAPLYEQLATRPSADCVALCCSALLSSAAVVVGLHNDNYNYNYNTFSLGAAATQPLTKAQLRVELACLALYTCDNTHVDVALLPMCCSALPAAAAAAAIATTAAATIAVCTNGNI